jgi:NhaP-type Na+/H+ or K+/H+ antiporter
MYLASAEPTSAVLFPWFVEILGVMVFFLLTKFELPVPYAAVMFLLGVFMGWGAVATVRRTEEGQELDQLTESILQWSNINSGVLLLVFLPGLIFRDAIEVNFNLFMKALPQILILAFPMVLVGTLLTAVVTFYLFNWPLSLCATLGAVLSSTDPVAVGSVLKSAGAPPRLQMLISGESLLNDGSAVVFFTIFSQQFLADLGVEGAGVDFAQGFATFFRMALGGTVVGFAFSLGLLTVLYELDRRLEPEYNVLQVVAALTIAYLSYYVSEQVCGMSGVIACVVCGITARALGRGLITDNRLMDSYLALMEYLLNTLLFTLGGVVYGKVISETSTRDIAWDDWIYLGLVYLMITGIRFFQVALFYPVVSRVGLKTNWSEALFLGFGGLRGAVGIALGLSLNRLVRENTDDPEALQSTKEMEFLAGGVTFLSLFVNGGLAGFVLKWLDLAKPAVSRKRTLRLLKLSAEYFMNDEFAKLMKEKRYMRTDVRVIQELIPFLTLDLQSALPEESQSLLGIEKEEKHASRLVTVSRQTCPDETLQEIRGLYLDLLKEAYGEEVHNQELDEREDNGLNLALLQQSVSFAAADIDHQEPIHDFQYTQNFPLMEDIKSFVLRQREHFMGSSGSKECPTYRYQEERAMVLRAISFIEAHESAEYKLSSFVQSLSGVSIDDDEMATFLIGNAIDIVMSESAQQVAEAEAELSSFAPRRIDNIVSNHVATIMLRRLADFIERRASDGFLTKNEARIYLNRIDHNIRNAHDGRRDDSEIQCSTVEDEEAPSE